MLLLKPGTTLFIFVLPWFLTNGTTNVSRSDTNYFKKIIVNCQFANNHTICANVPQEDPSPISLHILSAGSIVCACVFVIILGAYMFYVQCKLNAQLAANGLKINRRPTRPIMEMEEGDHSQDPVPLIQTNNTRKIDRELPPIPNEHSRIGIPVYIQPLSETNYERQHNGTVDACESMGYLIPKLPGQSMSPDTEKASKPPTQFDHLNRPTDTYITMNSLARPHIATQIYSKEYVPPIPKRASIK